MALRHIRKLLFCAFLAIGKIETQVMAVMGALGQLEHGLNEELAVHTPPLPGLGIGEWTLSVATNFRWRPLGYAVEDAILAAIQDGRMEKIFKDHGLTYTPPKW